MQTRKGPVDTAAPLVPHDCGLATHDRLECTGTKDNQISFHLEYLLLGLFVSFGARLTKLNSVETSHGSSRKDIPTSLQGACGGSRPVLREETGWPCHHLKPKGLFQPVW